MALEGEEGNHDFKSSKVTQVKANIVFQDNKSAMKLEINSKASSGKRTRHFDIIFFYFTDLITRGEMQVKYCTQLLTT